MALPTTAGLDVTDWATPYVLVSTKSTVNAYGLDVIDWATPFLASTGGAAATPTNTLWTYVNINGTWKLVNTTYVKINSEWKVVTSTGVKISDTWKI